VLSQSPYGLPFVSGWSLGKRGVKLDIHCGLAALRNSSQVGGRFMRRPCRNLQDHRISIAEIELKKAPQSSFNFQNPSNAPIFHTLLHTGARCCARRRTSPRRPPLIRWRHCHLVGGANPCEAEGCRRCRCCHRCCAQSSTPHRGSVPRAERPRGRGVAAAAAANPLASLPSGGRRKPL
jgi:hypothetical protein